MSFSNKEVSNKLAEIIKKGTLTIFQKGVTNQTGIGATISVSTPQGFVNALSYNVVKPGEVTVFYDTTNRRYVAWQQEQEDSRVPSGGGQLIQRTELQYRKTRPTTKNNNHKFKTLTFDLIIGGDQPDRKLIQNTRSFRDGIFVNTGKNKNDFDLFLGSKSFSQSTPTLLAYKNSNNEVIITNVDFYSWDLRGYFLIEDNTIPPSSSSGQTGQDYSTYMSLRTLIRRGISFSTSSPGGPGEGNYIYINISASHTSNVASVNGGERISQSFHGTIYKLDNNNNLITDQINIPIYRETENNYNFNSNSNSGSASYSGTFSTINSSTLFTALNNSYEVNQSIINRSVTRSWGGEHPSLYDNWSDTKTTTAEGIYYSKHYTSSVFDIYSKYSINNTNTTTVTGVFDTATYLANWSFWSFDRPIIWTTSNTSSSEFDRIDTIKMMTEDNKSFNLDTFSFCVYDSEPNNNTYLNEDSKIYTTRSNSSIDIIKDNGDGYGIFSNTHDSKSREELLDLLNGESIYLVSYNRLGECLLFEGSVTVHQTFFLRANITFVEKLKCFPLSGITIYSKNNHTVLTIKGLSQAGYKRYTSIYHYSHGESNVIKVAFAKVPNNQEINLKAGNKTWYADIYEFDEESSKFMRLGNVSSKLHNTKHTFNDIGYISYYG